ncbi:MAG: hypothetical protein K9J79_10235 [Desulfobacteraceae bacterium]|nr:hypothetical protein [Desulfobacteraceae bacterium]
MPFDNNSLNHTLAMALLAYIFTIIGYYSESRIKIGQRIAKIVPERNSLQKYTSKPFLKLRSIALAIGIFSAVLTIISGVELSMTASALEKNLPGYDNILHVLRSFAAFLLTVQLTKEKFYFNKFNFLTIFLLIVVFFATAVAVKSKGIFLLPFIVLLLINFYSKGRKINLKLFFSGIVIILVFITIVYPAVNMLRKNSSISVPNSSALEIKQLTEAPGKLFDRISYLEEVHLVFQNDKNNEKFRENSLSKSELFFWFFIPRFLYPEKPILTQGHLQGHYLFGYNLKGNFINSVSILYIGDCFLYNGFCGLILWAFIYGYGFRFIYSFFVSSRNYLFLAYYIFSIRSIFGLIEGGTLIGLLSFTRSFIVFYVALMVIVYIPRAGRPLTQYKHIKPAA